MLKLVSFHIQAHLNAFLQILECFPNFFLRPLARESSCIWPGSKCKKFNSQFVIRKAHSPFQRELTGVCHLVSPLKVIQQLLTCSSWSSHHFNPSCHLSLNNVLQKAVQMQHVTNPANLLSFYGNYDIPFIFDSNGLFFHTVSSTDHHRRLLSVNV